MPLIEQLLASVGVGAATLTLQVDSAVCPRGGEIEGRLALEGGDVEQRIESLTVRLIERYSQGKGTAEKVRDQQIVSKRFLYDPCVKTTVSFRFRLPDDARLTRKTSADGWRVAAEADILWAINPRANVDLEVVPHHEVTAVQLALERLGFARTSVYLEFALPESPDTIVRYYKAPPHLREQIDGASLHLRVLEDYVHGRLILNRRQHSVGERLLAMVGADREEHELMIVRQDLLNAEGGPRYEGATKPIEDVLNRSLILPENVEERTLLRPTAGPPPGANSLLRPAGPTDSISADELLRPTDAPPPASELPSRD